MTPVSPADPGSESVVTSAALEVPGTARTQPAIPGLWFGQVFFSIWSQQWLPSSEVQAATPAPVFFSDPATLCSFSDINCSPQVLRGVHMEPPLLPTCSGGREPSIPPISQPVPRLCMCGGTWRGNKHFYKLPPLTLTFLTCLSCVTLIEFDIVA